MEIALVEECRWMSQIIAKYPDSLSTCPRLYGSWKIEVEDCGNY